jgi:hypothetical protein
MQRNRVTYFLFLIIVILLGLGSRYFANVMPGWVHLYLGDVLWALMVFILVALVFKVQTSIKVACIALAFSFGIEISQLYHAPWIDSIRNTHLGGLVLGYGFLWSDLVCYTLGVTFGYLVEKLYWNKI